MDRTLTSERYRWAAAALLSVLIYVMPPFEHGRPLVVQLLYDFAGADPFGEGRRSLIIEVPGGSEAVLLPALIGLILAVQFGLTLILQNVLFRRRTWSRIIGAILAVISGPTLVALGCDTVLPLSFRLAEPALIRSRRPFPERAGWTVECNLENYELDPFIDTPPDGGLGRSGQVWIRHRSEKRFTILSMPGCRVYATALSDRQVMETQFYGATGGAAIYVRNDGIGVTPSFDKWWYVATPSAAPQLISPPLGADASQPALSSNGEWVGWIVESSKDWHAHVTIRRMRTGETMTIESQELTPGKFWLLGVDTESKTVLVARKGYEEAVLVDLDGRLRLGPITIGNSAWPESVVQRVLLRQGGWVGWYGAPLRDTVEWHLPIGQGTYRVGKGTQINSVDVSPNGHLIAIGTDGDFPGSAVESSAVVIDTASGSELFRKYFPRRCWVRAAFLGDQYFAYSSSPHNFAIGGAKFKIAHVPR